MTFSKFVYLGYLKLGVLKGRGKKHRSNRSNSTLLSLHSLQILRTMTQASSVQA
jgi:hypothetical protein